MAWQRSHKKRLFGNTKKILFSLSIYYLRLVPPVSQVPVAAKLFYKALNLWKYTVLPISKTQLSRTLQNIIVAKH